jgi:MFS family permease
MMEEETEDTYSLDEALELNKIGFYHYRLLVLCGLGFMTDSLEVNLLSFLSVCAAKEWNLSASQEASITGIVFAGMICGSWCWGVISDWKGRKTTFFLCSAIITIGGLLTGIATSFPLLLFFRGIVGFGVGGTNIAFDLLAELLPSSQRGVFLVFIQFFWTVGTILVTLLAWMLLDSSGWRTLALLTVIPVAITSICSYFYLPESPRWLMSVGKKSEAERVVRDACRVNGHPLPPSFALKDNLFQHEPAHNLQNYLEIVRNPSLRRIIVPLWAVWCAFGVSYYGIILLMTRLFSNNNSSNHGSDNNNSHQCQFEYPAIFYNSLSEIAGVFLGGFLLDQGRVGRVSLQVITYLLAGICVFLTGFLGLSSAVSSSLGIGIAGFIGRLSVSVASVRKDFVFFF